MLVLKQMTKDAPPPYVPCDWETGTDAEIAEALEKHYAGEVDLYKYWSIGIPKRTITLSAIPSSDIDGTQGSSPIQQSIDLVLMNKGGKQLVSSIEGHSECIFVVGIMQQITTTNNSYWKAKMNTTNTSAGGWESCALRNWCNNDFRDAIPKNMRKLFKKFYNPTANGANSSAQLVNSEDYFSLLAEKELYGSIRFMPKVENALEQFDIFDGDNANISIITANERNWLRSPVYSPDSDTDTCFASTIYQNYQESNLTFASSSRGVSCIFGVI